MATIEPKIPQAPNFLPEKDKKKWEQSYVDAHKEAQVDFPEDSISQHQAALREANRMIRVPKLESYEDAMKQPAHLFIKRDPSEKGDELLVVTVGGAKYRFSIPKSARKAKPAEVDDTTPPVPPPAA